MHFAEEHFLVVLRLLCECADEYAYLLLIKHLLRGLRDITNLDGKDFKLTS